MPIACLRGRVRSVCPSDLPLATDPESFFSGQKYFLLGDSAFANSESVVTSFKAPRGHALTPEQEAFNTKVGNLRVTSEHTIGMLKARFPFLRSIPMKITDDPKSLRRILRVIDCCIILHNLLIDIDDDVPEEWWESDVNDGDIATAVGEPNFLLHFSPTAQMMNGDSGALTISKTYVVCHLE